MKSTLCQLQRGKKDLRREFNGIVNCQNFILSSLNQSILFSPIEKERKTSGEESVELSIVRILFPPAAINHALPLAGQTYPPLSLENEGSGDKVHQLRTKRQSMHR